MDNGKLPQSTCGKCNIVVDATGVGSATGRLYYRCPSCGVEWAGKNAAAVILGSAGGKKTAECMTPEERKARAAAGGRKAAEKMTPEERKARAAAGGNALNTIRKRPKRA